MNTNCGGKLPDDGLSKCGNINSRMRTVYLDTKLDYAYYDKEFTQLAGKIRIENNGNIIIVPCEK